MRAAAGAPIRCPTQSQALTLAEAQTRVCARYIQGDCAADTLFHWRNSKSSETRHGKFARLSLRSMLRCMGWLSAFMRERLYFDIIKSSAARAAYMRSSTLCARRRVALRRSMTRTAGVSSRSRSMTCSRREPKACERFFIVRCADGKRSGGEECREGRRGEDGNPFRPAIPKK